MKSPIPVLFAATLLSVASLPGHDRAEPVRLCIDLDRTVLPAGSAERAIVKIGLDCLKRPLREPRPAVNLALVIDRSGSMGGDKIARAREAARELVRQLGPDDIISIVAYDSEVEVLVPAQRVGRARGLAEAIGSLEAGGNTALHGGVVRGAAEVRRFLGDERHVPRVILLSDGQANVGPSSPEELGRLGAALMREGMAVTTIGLGLGYNEDLMTRLAERSDGNTYFVEDSSDLPGIFAAELGDVLNVVARRVVIEIDFPEGVRPLRFVGRDGRIHGSRAELALNQLYGGQEKFALIEVEVTPSAAGREREIARARVGYEDALTGRAVALTATQRVRFSADRQAVVASANHAVQADHAANSLAVAKDEAIALADAGRRDEAAALIRARADDLQRLADTYGNRLVGAAAPAAVAEADRLEREGLSNAQRKTYRAEIQQTRNQQSTTPDRP